MAQKTSSQLGFEFLTELEKIFKVRSGATKYPVFEAQIRGSVENLSLLRVASVFELTAGIFVNGTASEKARAVRVAAEAYKHMVVKGIISYKNEPSGKFPHPGGAAFLKGLISLDLARMFEHPDFSKYSGQAQSRLDSRIGVHHVAQRTNILDATNAMYRHQSPVIEGLAKGNSAKATYVGPVKIASSSINGDFATITALMLYTAKYGDNQILAHQKNGGTYQQLESLFNRVSKQIALSFGNTFDSSGREIFPTYSGQYPTASLCLPIGGWNGQGNIRAPYASAGYSTLVAEYMVVGEIAKILRNNKSMNMRKLHEAAIKTPISKDAIKIANYFRDKAIENSGRLYDLHAPYNKPGSADNFRSAWEKDREKFKVQHLGNNGQTILFETLPEQATAMAYTLGFVSPTHNLFQEISKGYGYNTTSKSKSVVEYLVEERFNGKAQVEKSNGAALARVLGGIGSMLQFGQQQIKL